MMTREDWLERVRSGFFIDYDGFCEPVKDGKVWALWFYPSQSAELPADCDHVVWFNR